MEIIVEIEEYKGHIDRLLARQVESGRVKGASALIIHNGEEMYFGCNGMADADKNMPMKRDTIIRLFSMSKPITAAAAMIAQERGLIDLLDPVYKYLPEYKNLTVMDEDGTVKEAVNTMTLMHLITMTSGIVYGENWEGCSQAGKKMDEEFNKLLKRHGEGERLSTREVAKFIASVPLAFEPGREWKYGFSADVLGAVIEVASGLRYSDFLKKYIFEPLGMVDTGFFVPDDKRDRFAMSYQWDYENGPLYACDESHLLEYYYEDVAFESGGAGMVSTLDDYAKFAQMLCNGGIFNGKRILGDATVEFMKSNHLTREQSGALDWDSNSGYGYGCLMRSLINPAKAGMQIPLAEFGWDGWTGNYMSIDQDNRLVTLYFIQRRGAGSEPVIRMIKSATYAVI